MWRNRTSGKAYVGYTGQCVIKRWKDHVRSAIRYNQQTRFYHAIRKYGPHDWDLTILCQVVGSKIDAMKKEAELILEMNTLENGYNATKGATGGWIVRDVESWKQKLSEAHSGTRNGNYSGITDAEILAEHVKFSLAAGRIISVNELRRKSNLAIPKHFVKWRFGGNVKNLYSECQRLTGYPAYHPYQKTPETKKKLSEAILAKNSKN